MRSTPPGRTKVTHRAAALGLLLGLCLAAIPGPGWSRVKAKKERKTRPILERVGDHLEKIVDEGDHSLYVSGYAYHFRSTYGPTLVDTLNETAWGGGYGRTLRDEKGHATSLALTAFVDSIGDVQYNLGYMREWCWKPFGGDFILGGGLSAFMMSRPDYFDGLPFPAVLPQLSLGIEEATLITMYVPKIPGETATPAGLAALNGDIFYFFGRFTLP